MALEPEKLVKKLADLGHDWADKDAAFFQYDETKKDVLAECKALVNDQDLSETAKETEARRMPQWKEHVQKMIKARHELNHAKVSYTTCQTYCELLRSKEATARAEMTLV